MMGGPNDDGLFTQAHLFKQNDPVDTVFIVTCLCFAMPIIPAVGLGYSGYSTRKNGLASFFPAMIAMAVCSVQWWLVGYTIAFGEGGNGLFGGFGNAFHIGVDARPIGTIPAILFSAFQLAFEAAVCAIALGGACERGRLLPLFPFAFLWGCLVYCPIAHMVWGANGFLAEFGALDFAGGTPVHICSGASATAISVYMSHPLFRSKRSSKRTPAHLKLHRAHNSISQLLAMTGIWTGWLAFESGTAMALNYKAIFALLTTNLCAASGCITWLLLDYRKNGLMSLDSCLLVASSNVPAETDPSLGAISGLVFITPAAGFVGIASAAILGVIGTLICRTALKFKSTEMARRMKWVDNGDSFATHCIGGFCATITTGLFASREVAAYDGATEIIGGVIFDRHYAQLGIQIVEALVGFFWAGGMSYLIICVLDCIPGLEVLATDAGISSGMDKDQMNESLWDAQWHGEEDYEPMEGMLSLN